MYLNTLVFSLAESLQCPFGLNCEWDANEQVYDILSADKLTSSHCDKGAHCCLKKGDRVHKWAWLVATLKLITIILISKWGLAIVSKIHFLNRVLHLPLGIASVCGTYLAKVYIMFFHFTSFLCFTHMDISQHIGALLWCKMALFKRVWWKVKVLPRPWAAGSI